MKKIFKILGIVLLVFILILVAAPFFLKGKIAQIIKNKVNANVEATFDFSDASLSLFKNFPQATLTMENISLANKAPFEGDTLFLAKKVGLEMSIKELFKDASEPIAINSLTLDGAHVNILVDKDGNASYDIGKKTDAAPETPAAEEESSDFQLELQSYAITNSRITYHDLGSGMLLDLQDMNHSGTGDLSLEKSELDTHTDALVTFEMDSTNYLNKNKIKLDALVGVDLAQNRYSFLKNEALINQLPLVFDGFVQVNEDNQEVDVNFKTPSSDFKNFLAVIPEVYSKNIQNVQTSGNFTVAGSFKGVVDEEHIPKFNINLNSNNASFKYPDLPKTVKNIQIDAEVVNTTGITEDTYVDLKKLSFNIDSDRFNLVSRINDLMGNPKVNAHLDGHMNLANLAQAYPMPQDLNLKGILDADVTTSFDMASVEQKRYENTKTNGKLELQNFAYSSEELANPVAIQTASVTFNPQTVSLNKLEGKTGRTDFNATGTINNLLGFMFNDEKVEGRFDLKSNTFALNDFMTSDTAEAPKETSSETKSEATPAASSGQIKIPSFLDCTINAAANTVIYDNLTLKNVSANMVVRDETATLNNFTSSLFDGKLALNGEVSTKQETPSFAMKLDMSQFNIAETFGSLELLQTLAPIANVLQGKLNTNIELKGNLTQDLLPKLTTLTGNALAEIMTTKVDTEKAPLLAKLDNNLSFIDLDKLNLKDLKTALTFEDGLVKVKPFTINYQDISMNITGSHTFDQKMDYKATIEVPAKYLGTEVNQLIAKIDDSQLQNLTIPVTATIGGSFSNPQVGTDLTSGVKSLTSKLVEIEKQKLMNQGKEKAKDLLSNLIKKDSTKQDSTKTGGVKEALGNIFKNQGQKTQDTVKTDTTSNTKKDAVKTATNILGGLLGKKKKDTVNQH